MAMRWLWLLLLLGCGPRSNSGPKQPVAIPEVATGLPVPTAEATIIMTASGEIFRNGVLTTIATLPETQHVPGQSLRDLPILIEADARLGVKDVTPLIAPMIERGKCANISFIVHAPTGRATIPICIPVAWSPPGLRFWDGTHEFNELGKFENEFDKDHGYERGVFHENNHLWIELRAEPLRLQSLTRGGWMPCADQIWYGDNKKKSTGDVAWMGERPPSGTLTTEMLKAFLARPDISKEGPILVLRAWPDDHLSACVQLAAELRTLGPQVMFMIHGKE